MQFSGDAFGQFAGQLGALGSVMPQIGISGNTSVAPCAVCPLVTAHVDQLGSPLTPQGGFDDRFGRADERGDSRLVASPGSRPAALTPPGGSMADVI